MKTEMFIPQNDRTTKRDVNFLLTASVDGDLRDALESNETRSYNMIVARSVPFPGASILLIASSVVM